MIPLDDLEERLSDWISDEGGQLGTEAFGRAWEGRHSQWLTLAQAAQWIMTNADIRKLAARIADRVAIAEMAAWIETIHRVWGSDWFQRPVEQLERIVAAIEAAKAELADREQAGRIAGRAVPVEVVTVERADVTEVGLQGTLGNRAGRT